MLTADRNTPSRDGRVIPTKVAASTTIFMGAIVALDATGFAQGGAAGTDLTYWGRADEFVDNSAGADGDKEILVRRHTAFHWANSGSDPVTQASVGAVAYIEDDETVAATDGTGTLSAAGTVIYIDDAGVWIE